MMIRTQSKAKSGSAKKGGVNVEDEDGIYNQRSKDSFLNKQQQEHIKVSSKKSEIEEEESPNDESTQTETETKTELKVRGNPNNAAIRVVAPLTSITFLLAMTILYTIYKDQLDTLLNGLNMYTN
ncbi:unnamed protein product [Ambrosiozyma monospora]|uniref:Unnamed protein product n=1 Tax=Ambrosiozyma monospora TaxID=43982 RepID=A0ACB5TUH4_AMBMO|nr:unnamed protein product [Ambrosiozyma monospora]